MQIPLRYILFTFLMFSMGIGIAQTTINIPITNGNDDAEENITDGSVDVLSSDLELIRDGGRGFNQIIGMRFRNVNVPQGSTILSASIQFTVDEVDNGGTSLVIHGEGVDNAAIFTTTVNNISGRTPTFESVSWNSIPAWNAVGETSANQRTPDLTNIVQEIVNRGGWASGNAMVFLIDGSGERVAESYDGEPTLAPVLTITANLPIDSDSDGVSDQVDLDDDNDGILDAHEEICGPDVGGFDAYWNLEDSTDDTSGNSHNLRSGNVGYSADSRKGLKSASLNGSSQYLTYSDGTFLNQQITDFSYSFWIKPVNLLGTQTLLDEGGGTNGIAIRLNGNTLENAIREGGGVNADLQDGEYTIFEDISATAAWATSIWQTQGDHTTGSDRMMIVNANNTAGLEFYRRQLVKVSENVPLLISFWVMNIDTNISSNNGRTEPDITVLIQQGGTTVYSFDTGAVAREPDGSPNAWKNFTGSFTPATETALEIVLINNAPGGQGNDLALDDIEILQSFCDADGDGTPNSLQADSDGDGCNDADEAYTDANADADNNGMYGMGSPAVNADGTVIAASYQTPADEDGSSISDFLEAGTTATITENPMDAYIADGADATFTVNATGSSLNYQWQVSTDGGLTYVDITGETNRNLIVSAVSNTENGNQYRVLITDTSYICSEVTSTSGILFISPDTDGDGVVDLTDLDDDNDGILDSVEDDCATTTNLRFADYTDATTGFMDGDLVLGVKSYSGFSTSDGTQYDIVLTTSIASGSPTAGNGATGDTSVDGYPGIQLAGEGVIIQFFYAGTTIPIGLSGFDFRISDFETNGAFGETMPLFRYKTNDGQEVEFGSTFGWNGWEDRNGVQFGASGSALGVDADGDLTTSYPGAGGTQNNKYVRLNIPNRKITEIEIVNHNDAGGFSFGWFNSNLSVVCDLDQDGIPNILDTDSDGDGCNDADEAYTDANADADNNGMYGTGSPAVNADGTVIAASYQTPADEDSNGIYDFLEIGSSPMISAHPQNQNAEYGDDVTFSVIHNGIDSSYQWQVSTNGGATFNDISGATNASLTVLYVTASEDGNQYRAIVTENNYVCSETISNSGELSVTVPDFDADGSPDLEDLDDDNDGIPDDQEGCLTYAQSIESQSGVGNPAGILGSPDSSFAEIYTDGDIITIDFQREFPAGTEYILTWQRRAGRPGETARPIVSESADNTTFTLLSYYPETSVNGVVADTITSENNFRYLRFSKQTVPSVTDYQIDAVEVISCVVDTDGDGLTDNMDLDSDNDGIFDVVEAGHDRPHSLGIINGAFGANGLADVVETAAESGFLNYSILNTDSLTSPDFQDTDSDEDGCSDANEAYVDNNADGGDNEYYGVGNPSTTDSQGRVTAATYPVPANGNGTLDYRELESAPNITTQPTDASACPSGDTSFEVVSSNGDTYQWQLFSGGIWSDLSNTGIHSGTDSAILAITNAQISDNGNEYRVIVSKSSYICNTATSDEVTLTVAAPVVNAVSNQEICDGESVTLTASATGGTSGYTYLWNTGQTSASITFTPSGDPDTNINIDYTVTVTDSNECQDSDTVRVAIESSPTVTVNTNPASCGLDNGEIVFNFPDHPNRTGIEFSLDNQVTYESGVNDNNGSSTYSGLMAGTYRLWARWGNDECPVDLGDHTISSIPQVTIDTSPVDQTVFVNESAIFSVGASESDTYQWQISTDGGINFSDINDGAKYSGTQTTTLTASTIEKNQNGYLYRVIASNSVSSCPPSPSNTALLTVRVKTVITNRRITHRVKKN